MINNSAVAAFGSCRVVSTVLIFAFSLTVLTSLPLPLPPRKGESTTVAIVGFGGVLGMGEKYHPVPWSTLNYDPDENSYVVNLTEDQLKAAPADSIEELTKNDGLGYRDQTYAYYKAKPYWQ